jgi:antirestriction protein ArdC
VPSCVSTTSAARPSNGSKRASRRRIGRDCFNDNAQYDQSPKQDIYARITAKIIAALEDGVRPWVRPWNAEHAAGRITRPLRHNGQPYTGINILSLWASANVQGFAAPIWMTDRQAVGLRREIQEMLTNLEIRHAHPATRTLTVSDAV